jgi:hypothetical protein
VILLAAGTGLGLVLLATRKAKAATAPSSRELPPSSPAPRPPPLQLSSSNAREGEPLAWDKREHPLAQRGTDDAAAAELEVIEMPLSGTQASDPDFPPYVHTVIDVPAPDRTPAKPPAPTAPARASAPAAPAPSAPSSARAKPKAKPPAPPAPAAPSSRTPEQAASALYSYAKAALAAGKGAQLGIKGAPSSTVHDAQRDMGGLVADGIYGPATRERGHALINKTFPARK